MIFITRWNLKTIISILMFTFYIINQIFIIILYQIRLVFLILEIKYCLTEIKFKNVLEVLEQSRGRTPALNVVAIRDQRNTNVSKQRTLLADVDVAPHRTHARRARTHTTITHIKAWADLDFISDTVTVKRQWL